MVEIILSGFAILSVFLLLWYTAKFVWLDNICTLLVISLPFERIPSVEIAGANLRISQILVVVGLWTWLVLFLKKDAQLAKLKLNKINTFLLLFVIFSIPSYFLVIDSKRFLVTIIATYLCFGAVFLLSNFALNINKKIKYLLYSLIFVCAFGLYQFLGDLAGLPIYLTGLREQYTKIVFGVPRIQSTALEPLYFAGMLYTPILYIIVSILSRSELKFFSHISSAWSKSILISIFVLVFFLTISKAAIVILVPIFLGLLIYSIGKLDTVYIIKKIGQLFIYLTFILSLIMLFFADSREIVNNIIINFFATITFQFASSIERLNFLISALILLPSNIIIGIGSGQYGTWVNQLDLLNSVPQPSGEISYAIVNNVYLEVWLEFGILSFVSFMLILLYPVLLNFKILNNSLNWKTETNLTRLVLTFSLLANYLQWLTFSPIFIMPIFIIIGLAAKQSENTESTTK